MNVEKKTNVFSKEKKIVKEKMKYIVILKKCFIFRMFEIN
jgi:hypothetical protein